MALIMGYIKDLDIEVPLKREITFKDDEGHEHLGWEIALEELEEVFWPKLLADMRKRFPDAPKDDLEFRSQIMAQGGLPVRSERVNVTFDLRGFL